MVWKKLNFGVIFYMEIFISFLVFNQFESVLIAASAQRCSSYHFRQQSTSLSEQSKGMWTPELSLTHFQLNSGSTQILCPQVK